MPSPAPRSSWTGVLAAALLTVAVCAASDEPPPVPTGPPVPVVSGEVPTPDHVLVAVFENEDFDQVVGSDAAPFLTSLARSGADFTDAHAETHPSQPNYIALFSGSTHGVTDDSCPLALSGPNLAGELLAAGRTFVGYSEDLPSAGAADCRAGGYQRKHNPWADFAGLPPETNQPYTAFPDDFADLPTVAVVVPNLCHDMHDCGVPIGDRWAHDHLAGYARWARTHNSLLVITCDESDGGDADGNRIPTVLVGPMVRAGEDPQTIDHYSILRTIEEMYGLAPLGVARNRAPITGIWTPPGD